MSHSGYLIFRLLKVMAGAQYWLAEQAVEEPDWGEHHMPQMLSWALWWWLLPGPRQLGCLFSLS